MTYIESRSDSEDADRAVHEIIVSTKFDSHNKTEIWEVTMASQKKGRIEKVRVIPFGYFENEFYTAADLKKRFKQVETNEGEKYLLFMPSEEEVAELGEEGINIQETMSHGDVVLGIPEYPENTYTRLVKVPNGQELQLRADKKTILSLPRTLLDLNVEVRTVFGKEESAIGSGSTDLVEYFMVVTFKTGEKEQVQTHLVYLVKKDDSINFRNFNITSHLKTELKGSLKSRIFIDEDDKGNKIAFLDVSRKINKTELVDIKRSVVSNSRVDNVKGNENLRQQQQALKIQEKFNSLFSKGLKIDNDSQNEKTPHSIVDSEGNVLAVGKVEKVFDLEDSEYESPLYRVHKIQFLDIEGEVILFPFKSDKINKGALLIVRWRNKENKFSYRAGTVNFLEKESSHVNLQNISDLKLLVNGAQSAEEMQSFLDLQIENKISELVDSYGDDIHIEELEDLDQEPEILAESIRTHKVQRLKSLRAKYTDQWLEPSEEELERFTQTELNAIRFNPYDTLVDNIEFSIIIETSHEKNKPLINVSDPFSTGFVKSKRSGRRSKSKSEIVTEVPVRQTGPSDSKDFYTLDAAFKLRTDEVAFSKVKFQIRNKDLKSDLKNDEMLARYKQRWLWITQSENDVLSKNLALTDLHNDKLIYKPNESQGRKYRRNLEYLVPPAERPVKFLY
ncbi:MAG: hypothetical protein KDD40_09610, partial [Bdellovibrionales bacterium]|nr:hypothetical protein [Bdellovibrionales bacterium]